MDEDPAPATKNDAVAKLQSAVETSVRRAWEHRHAYGLAPHPGSSASAEADNAESAPDRSESLRTAYSAAWMRVLASEDALLGIAKSLRDQPFAVASLARSAFEWCALAKWLLDRQVSENERLCRGMTDYIYSLWQVSRLIDDPEKKGYYTGRIQQEVSEAKSFGLEVVEVGRWQKGLFFVGQRRPTTSDLIERLFEPVAPGLGRFVWQLLSGIAHGTTGFMTEMFREESPPPSLPDASGPFAQKGGRKRALTMGATALIGFYEAFGEMVGLYGWDFAAWRQWQLQLSPGWLRWQRGMTSRSGNTRVMKRTAAGGA